MALFALVLVVISGQKKPACDEWQAVGSYPQGAACSIQWCIGDWLNYGERRYGETYAQAIEATGLDE